MDHVERAARLRLGWVRGSLATLVVLALLGAASVAASAEGPLRATFDPSSSGHQVDDRFDVDIRLENAVDLNGAEVVVHFDPRVLQVEDADGTPGNGVQIRASDNLWQGRQTLSCPQCNQTDNAHGVITYTTALMNGSEESGVTGSGILATIPFKAVGKGLSPLTFDPTKTTANVGPMLKAVDVAITDGQVWVGTTSIYLPMTLRP